MARFNLTNSIAKTFDNIRKLDEDIFKDLISALESAEIQISLNALIDEQLKPKLKELSHENLEDIIVTIMAFIRFHNDEKVEYDEIINDVIRQINLGKTEILKFKDNRETELFKLRLSALFENKNLEIFQSVSDLYFKHKNLFGSTEMTVDLRPIFTKGETKFAVISTELQINYRADQQNRNIFFALDRDDIKKLKEVIIEAETKIKIVEDAIVKLGMTELKNK